MPDENVLLHTLQIERALSFLFGNFVLLITLSKSSAKKPAVMAGALESATDRLYHRRWFTKKSTGRSGSLALSLRVGALVRRIERLTTCDWQRSSLLRNDGVPSKEPLPDA